MGEGRGRERLYHREFCVKMYAMELNDCRG